MRNIFTGYYRLTNAQLAELWKDCLFIVDANVLLNLYRYPKEAREDLIKVFRQISERLWIPHQAALEYQLNRLSVIAEQVKRFDDVRKVLTDAENSLRGGLAALQLKKRHSTIDPDTLLQKVENIFNEFTGNLDALEKEQPDVFAEDTLRNQIDSLFDGKVGTPPASQAELEKIYQEGKTRYERKCPPGYEDISKGKQGEKESDPYIYNGLTIKREYGDLLVWSQIIEEAKNRAIKHIIFVTDDEKEDWWWIVESKGRKTIGPRPELIEEILSKANVSMFYMYNSERFLKFAKEYLGAEVEQESINQVREVAELQKARTRNQSIAAIGFMVERAVAEWLKESNPNDEIIENRIGFPDFILVNQDNTRIGYDVKFVREPYLVRHILLRDRAYRGFYEISRGNLHRLKMVFAVDDKNKVKEIVSILNSPRIEIPEGVSFVVGVIVPSDNPDAPTDVRFVPMMEN